MKLPARPMIMRPLIRTLIILQILLLALPLAAEKLDHSELASIPVLHDGRIKPLDTFARVNLLLFNGKSSLKGTSALEWLTETLFRPDLGETRKIFNIENPEVVTALSLKQVPKHRYSYNEVSQAMRKILPNIRKLHDKDRKEKTLAQNQLEQLYFKILRYNDLSKSATLILPDFEIRSEKTAKKLALPANQKLTYLAVQRKRREISKLAERIRKIDPTKQNAEEKEIFNLSNRIDWISQDGNSQMLRLIPPLWGESEKLWHSLWGIIMVGKGSPKSARYLKAWEKLARAYRKGDATEWEQASQEVNNISQELSAPVARGGAISLEVVYNKLDPFTWSLAIYIFSFIALGLSWMFWPERLRKAAYVLLIVGGSVQLIGMIMRFIIMLRSPVATLYESIIFTAMIAVIIGLAVEFRRKNGMGILIGSISGAIIQFISLGYAADGDSMGMLAAVLNTNFWLAVHVTTIMIGYAACIVGGVLGHVYLVVRFLKPDDEMRLDQLYRNMLGIALVALFFTLLGTVTGGIWADQSWGRFWGWDPKENGALLIVLWLLWLMHGRLANYIKAPGYAAGMILNNIIVAVAWFGVNLLDIGLHSYGFAGNVAINLVMFSVAELLFALFGYLLATQRLKLKFSRSSQG